MKKGTLTLGRLLLIILATLAGILIGILSSLGAVSLLETIFKI